MKKGSKILEWLVVNKNLNNNGMVQVLGLSRPIVLVKCWNVADWNAKKLLTKFQKLLPKFLDIFI